MEDFWGNVREFFWQYGAVTLESVIIIVFGFLAVRIFKKILRRALSLSRLDGMVLNLAVKIVGFVLDLLIVIWVLSMFNVSLTGIVVLASAVSLAVSLAIQDWLGNFASGLSLAATKPFKVGDYVLIGGTEGYVRQIRFMNTVIDTLDNKKATIPNKTVFNSQIINFSTNPTRMVELYFCVDYDTDIQRAKEVITSVIKSTDKILSVPAPLVRLYEQAESCLKIRVRIWTLNENYFDTLYYLEEEVLIAFRANGINIPFNQVQLSYRESAKPFERRNVFASDTSDSAFLEQNKTETQIGKSDHSGSAIQYNKNKKSFASSKAMDTVSAEAEPEMQKKDNENVAVKAKGESLDTDSKNSTSSDGTRIAIPDAFKTLSQMSLDELADCVDIMDRRQRRDIKRLFDNFPDGKKSKKGSAGIGSENGKDNSDAGTLSDGGDKKGGSDAENDVNNSAGKKKGKDNSPNKTETAESGIGEHGKED